MDVRAADRSPGEEEPSPAEPLAPGSMPVVAYFSPEFGVSERIPQYSGGLGVLAGDYLKVCSDEDRPLVGVGLFYHLGYFHQQLDEEGWQRETYRQLEAESLGLGAVAGAPLELELGPSTVRARVWRQSVGRIPLYLLDTSGVGNPEELEGITDLLYGGDTEHRLRQEILLGMGGVRALAQVGERAQLFHSNEGHAGFLVLERIRSLVRERGLDFEEALQAARAATIFTTHTPVPAGIDHFPSELMRRYFEGWCRDVGIGFERLMALGHFPGQATEDPFNMAVMGLRLSARANAVSQLHRRTSQRMFSALWPGLLPREVPIQAVTNGVHARHWASPEMAHLLDRFLGPRWDVHGAADWRALNAASDLDLWQARQPGRERLVALARARRERAGGGEGAEALDPAALTIGFARRVAEYKRALLLFSQPERLARLLQDPDRPIQLVIAGKAHPQDQQGKQIIQELVRRAATLSPRVAFLEDYDLELARALYQGSDLWLNTPRRPLEACGTSGQKAALSGALNCSILDGWWDEAYDGRNGFAIPSHDDEADHEVRDRLEAEELFRLLEEQVVPAFFSRPQGGPPPRWMATVRRSLVTVGPLVLGSRMVADYVRRLYRPALEAPLLSASDPHAAARARHGDWGRLERALEGASVSARLLQEPGGPPPGRGSLVEAEVRLGGLEPAEVRVELLQGPLDGQGRIRSGRARAMELDPPHSNGSWRYLGRLEPAGPGQGFAVRVLPQVHGGEELPAGAPWRRSQTGPVPATGAGGDG